MGPATLKIRAGVMMSPLPVRSSPLVPPTVACRPKPSKLTCETAMQPISAAFTLPDAVADAFNRSLAVLANADAFEDRVFYLYELVNDISAWRFCNAVTMEQEVYMLRQVRKEVEANMGVITMTNSESAVEITARQQNREEWDADSTVTALQ